MTTTVVPTPADGSSIAGGDTLSFHLHNDSGFAGNFSTIRIDLTINGVDQGFIYDASGPTIDPAYNVTDGATGTKDGDLSFSSIAGFTSGDTLDVVITAFADFDGGNFPFSFTVGAPVVPTRLASIPRSVRSRQQ